MVVLLCTGVFLRLYNLPTSYQFLGDQGRDAITVKRIFIDHDPVLIGPVTSTGNMYLGPLYYYWMLPFLMISYPNPIGPVYAIAVLSILTILAMYAAGKEMFGKWPALLGAAFFTFSYLAVEYGRFSWNPNPAPFVSVMGIWATFRAVKKSPWYWVLAGVCCAVLIQLHYVTLLIIPPFATIWLWQTWKLWHSEKRLSSALRTQFLAAFLAITLFVASLAPLALFDLRHDFINTRNFMSFVSTSGGPSSVPVNQKIWTILKETHGRSMHILFEIGIGKNRSLNTTLLLVVIVFLATQLWQNRNVPHTKTGQDMSLSLGIITVTLLWSVLGLSFFRGSVYDHYIAFLWPVTFWVYGLLITCGTTHKNSLYRWPSLLAAAAFCLVFLQWNVPQYPLQSLGWHEGRIASTAQTILDRVLPQEKYNVVLLTGTGDIEAQNYRYFLETSSKPPLVREQWGNTDTLFIINEDRKLKRVVDSPIYEIVVFPNKTPAEVYTIPGGPEITVLRRNR